MGLSQAPSDAGRCVIRHSNGCSLSMQWCICRNQSRTRLPSRVRGPDWACRHRQDSLRSGRGSEGFRMAYEGTSHPLVAAGARQWAHQRAVAPHPQAELANAGLTIIVESPAWRFRGPVARPFSRPNRALGPRGRSFSKPTPVSARDRPIGASFEGVTRHVHDLQMEPERCLLERTATEGEPNSAERLRVRH